MREIIEFNYLDEGKDALNHIHHSHGKSYEIIYVKSGSGVFVIDGDILPLQAGALYLINGLCAHCSVPDNPSEYRRRKLIIDAELIDSVLLTVKEKELADKLFGKGGSFFLPIDEGAREIDNAFLAIHNALREKKKYKYAYILSHVMRILLLASEYAEDHDPMENNEITKVISYIGANFKSKLSLNEISEAVNVSKYYLCHRFKKKLGMTIFEYILMRRLSYAKDKLISTDIPISIISNDAGFSDFSYFSKVFRQFEGITPSEFRNNNRTNGFK